MALAIPKRRSSQNFSFYHSSPAVSPPSFSRALKSDRIVPAHGKSASPVIGTEPQDVRKSPTFIPPNLPIDIVDFPNVSHPRIGVSLAFSAPVFVGGASIEGHVHITIDKGGGEDQKKSRPTLSISRIVVSLIGIERYNGRRRIFRRLATELLDGTHPPPLGMVPTGRIPSERSWEVLPSRSKLPFCLDLPIVVGPPPYAAKRQGILYLLSTTVEAKILGKQEFARKSHEVIVLTVHDPEKVLVNLPSPLQTSEELHLSGTHGSIILTAGLYRQTWISGYMLFVDIHINNGSNKTVNKIEVQLEKTTIVYSYPAASTEVGPASSLRVPDHCEKSIIARSILNSPRDAVPPHSKSTRTCRLEVPTGLASIDTGRFFGVRYFLNVQISCFFAKHVTVQLPITIIHPNSVDVPPNSLAQVTTAIEHKHKDLAFANGNPYRYTPGRAFTAARERPCDRLKATALSPLEVRDLTIRLDGSPRKLKSRRSRSTSVREEYSSYGVPRARTSLDSYGPSLQRGTSGMAFEDSDKENAQKDVLKTPTTIQTNRSPFSRSVLRERDVRAIRNSALAGLTGAATGTTEDGHPYPDPELMSHLSSQSAFPSLMALSSRLNSIHKSFSLPFLPQSFSSDLKPSPLSVHSTSSHSSNATTTHRQLPSSPPLTPSHPLLSPTFTATTSSTVKPYRLCTLCHHRIEGQEYSFPSSAPAALAALKSSLVIAPERTPDGGDDESGGHRKVKQERHFCRRCWIRIYDLSLCWTCGEVVHRGEERVGFGWCWWHWGCVGCLFCRAPLTPPAWTGDSRGIALTKPPLCKFCLRDVEAVAPIPTSTTVLLLPPTTPGQTEKARNTSKQFPRWMQYLPSNRRRKRELTTPQVPKTISAPSLPLKVSLPPSPPLSKSRLSPTSTISTIIPIHTSVAGDPPKYINELKSLFTASSSSHNTNSKSTQHNSTIFPPPYSSHRRDPSEADLDPEPDLGREKERRFFPPAPTNPGQQTLLTCAACGLSVTYVDAKAGPEGRFFHRACMVCGGCGCCVGDDNDCEGDGDGEGDFDGSDDDDHEVKGKREREDDEHGVRGGGVRWYCWAGEGRLRVSCRECWVRSTMAGGMGFDGVCEGRDRLGASCGLGGRGGRGVLANRVKKGVERVLDGEAVGCVVS